MTAFVLGNGESRLAVDPDRLASHGQVYGCNALYREFRPWVLVATDRDMAHEIEATGYAHQARFYTRRPQPGTGAQVIPRQYFGYSSGPVAVSLAAAERHDPIYLLGFDLGPDPHGRFNNVYAGTACYKPRGASPTFTGNWVRQIQRVVQDHARQTFVRVMGGSSATIAEFDSLGNLSHMAMTDFLQWLNTAKDG